jgi:hypothetical protein
MANTFSILPDGGRTRVFLCPACHETIALGCERCRFCSSVIDQQAAGAAADLMDRVNQACSDAEEIRYLLSMDTAAGDLALDRRPRGEVYLVPFLLARWWFQFGAIKIEDEDFKRAKRDLTILSWIGALLLVIGLIALAFKFLHK